MTIIKKPKAYFKAMMYSLFAIFISGLIWKFEIIDIPFEVVMFSIWLLLAILLMQAYHHGIIYGNSGVIFREEEGGFVENFGFMVHLIIYSFGFLIFGLVIIT